MSVEKKNKTEEEKLQYRIERTVVIVNLNNIPGVEWVFCKDTIKGATYLLGVVYRPPNSPISILKN